MPSNNYSKHDHVAVICLNNPPVNGMGHAMRKDVADNLDAAVNDDDVTAIVIIGAGKLFCGGADIKAFNTPASRAEPSSRTLIKHIEESSKPVIAAIHGKALGLGLEFAMGCHYRIAQDDAELGLPEVKLGLLPGGGGTQRLPRLIGVEAALQMIVEGTSVNAQEAHALGLVDEIVPGDLLEAAMAFAARVTGRCDHPVVSHRQAAAPQQKDYFDQRRAATRRGFPAPIECIACIEAATVLPFDEGIKFERERFDVLVNGIESKAMRHLFLAERAAAKLSGIPADSPVVRVGRVAIIGAGTMGAGIAMSFASAGMSVILVDSKAESLERGLSSIRKNYFATVAKGRLQQSEAEARIGRIEGTLDIAGVAQAELVIEAVFEDVALKKNIFAQLDLYCRPRVVLATNTSRLNIDEIAAATSRPEAVIGLHFFSPANVMRLVEVVRGATTGPQIIKTAMETIRRINKLPVLVGVCDGFVGNRMVAKYAREAEFLLEEGAAPEQVDGALKAFGFAMGRFTMADLAGLDISWAGRKRLAASRPSHLRYSKVADRICELGRFGQKTGAGFYRYEAGSRTPLPDPVVQQIIANCAREAGISRRAITDEEIIQRTMFALINEGAKILDEGIAQRASDIDLIYVNGYGFPAWRGGPMFYADTIGLMKVHARICEFQREHGEFWEPAPLLARLAKSDKTFARPD
jgi:3-hydroxyacyl-CoA dehydrogenase